MSITPGRNESTSAALNILMIVTTMRRLFVDQIRWIGATILSIAFGLPNREAVTARLMRNATDLANAFRQFYGDEFANRLELLFTAYFQTLIDLTDAYKAGDMQRAATLHSALYAILDQIASFLADRNRFWDAASLQVAFYELADLIERMGAAQFSGDYQTSIQLQDQAADSALRLSEDLAYGVVRQLQI